MPFEGRDPPVAEEGLTSRWFKLHYRYPRTQQERRANQAGFARAKRRPANLPTCYDDIPIRKERSWKRLRKTQYRTRTP